ncbi:MAG: zinc ribbon domain-containing protein [Thermococcus sp.]|uniref:double zinc ribbon domain-containing protein n=1 Tax=Thermococcus sp. TaxID=35749 RepID=UPI001D8B556E|nr:zinc ribbon domain-containing protein [Thermococcus sp.]MBO8175317.1 zinc ribbon domain-containing protein [Thermococcus sp.]
MEYSRIEKILASAFVLFLLLASINFLSELNNAIERPDFGDYESKYVSKELLENRSRLLVMFKHFRSLYEEAKTNLTKANELYIFKREEYRVALESGNATEEIKNEYLRAKKEYEKAYLAFQAIERAYVDIEKQLNSVNQQIDQQREKAYQEYRNAYSAYRAKVLALKLIFVIPVFLASFLIFRRYKNIYAVSLVAYSSLLFAYLIVQAVWNTFQVIGLSLFGAVATVLALYYIRKEYFKLEKLYKRRIGQNKCYSCGFPIKDDYIFCPNCGVKLKEKCEKCNAMKPIYLEFCPYCGTSLGA